MTLLFLRLATGLLGSFLESAVFWSSVLADLILEQFSARSALKTLFLELCSLSCVPGVVFIFLLPGILLFVLSRHLPVLPRSLRISASSTSNVKFHLHQSDYTISMEILDTKPIKNSIPAEGGCATSVRLMPRNINDAHQKLSQCSLYVVQEGPAMFVDSAGVYATRRN